MWHHSVNVIAINNSSIKMTNSNNVGDKNLKDTRAL